MKITAQFKGQDGSFGYKKGNGYTLHVDSIMGIIRVWRVDNDSPVCPYASIEAFLRNWSNVVYLSE